MAQFNSALITTNLLEAAVVELCMRLQRAEQQFSPAPGDKQPNKIQVALDTDAKTVKISALLPIEFGFGSDGSIHLVGVEYLPGVVPDDGYQPQPGNLATDSYRQNFVDSNLTPDLTVIHNLGVIPVVITVQDSEGTFVVPDDIVAVTSTTAIVKLQSYRPIAGVWTILIGT